MIQSSREWLNRMLAFKLMQLPNHSNSCLLGKDLFFFDEGFLTILFALILLHKLLRLYSLIREAIATLMVNDLVDTTMTNELSVSIKINIIEAMGSLKTSSIILLFQDAKSAASIIDLLGRNFESPFFFLLKTS